MFELRFNFALPRLIKLLNGRQKEQVYKVDFGRTTGINQPSKRRKKLLQKETHKFCFKCFNKYGQDFKNYPYYYFLNNCSINMKLHDISNDICHTIKF